MEDKLLDIFENSGYKLYRDESYKAEKCAEERKKKWQYHELRGPGGNIYPYSETQLAVQFVRDEKHRPTSFVRSKGYHVLQDADDFLVALFPVSDFELIAERLQLKKKRVISEKQKNAIKLAQQRRWNTVKV